MDMLYFGVCVCVFGIISPVIAFSHGAPEFSCKDPSTFHTRRINETHEGIIMPGSSASNPFSVVVETVRYRPGEKITVFMESSQLDKPLRGFFLQAVQADIDIRDLRRRAHGTFENSTNDEHPSPCQTFGDSVTGGITHSNSRDKQSIMVTWIAPTTYNPGDIQFLATGVYDYFTYWTDIRSTKLTPEDYPPTSENTITGQYTPTAAWYQWLQLLHRQQILRQHLGIPVTPRKDNGAGHDHHHDHHHHDHAHDHSHSMDSKSSRPISTTTIQTSSPATTTQSSVSTTLKA
ncbi:DOMON domain-containing protein frrs1L [Mactra antiquata]